MRYLCVIYTDEDRLAALSADEHAAVLAECHSYEERLRQSGRLVTVEALQPTCVATTVRVRAGRITVADGPAVPSREQVAGLFLINARDLNDAIRIASRLPPARLGGVEVRPVRERRFDSEPSGGQ